MRLCALGVAIKHTTLKLDPEDSDISSLPRYGTQSELCSESAGFFLFVQKQIPVIFTSPTSYFTLNYFIETEQLQMWLIVLHT